MKKIIPTIFKRDRLPDPDYLWHYGLTVVWDEEPIYLGSFTFIKMVPITKYVLFGPFLSEDSLNEASGSSSKWYGKPEVLRTKVRDIRGAMSIAKENFKRCKDTDINMVPQVMFNLSD